MLFNRYEDSSDFFSKENEIEKVSIQIDEKEYKVPKNINLLRAFHYLSLTTDDFEFTIKLHCWNGNCENCTCIFDDVQIGAVEGLSCLMTIDEDMKILQLPKSIQKKTI